jgi:hypothetical protein
LIIVSAAILDHTLKELLKMHLRESREKDDPLFGPNGAISSFSGLIDFAYRLKIIDDGIRSTLHLIRKIRNDCAHGTEPVSLDESPHKERIDEIRQRFSMFRGDEWTRSMIAMGISTSLIGSFTSGVWEIQENSKNNKCPFGKYVALRDGKISGGIYTQQAHPSDYLEK